MSFVFRSLSIRIDQSEFIKVSRLKPSQWKRLISELEVIQNDLKIFKKQIIMIEEKKNSDMENCK